VSVSKAVTKMQVAIIVAIIIIAAIISSVIYFVTLPSSPQKKVTEITWWQFGGIGPEHTYAQWLVQKFNENHTDIKVIWDHKSWETKRDILISSVIAGAAPDIITQDTGSLGDFVGMGYYVPLNNMSGWEEVKSKFVPEVLNCTYYNGAYWGIPTYFDGGPFICINVDAFKKAGLVDNAGNILIPKTWEQLIEYAQKAQEANPGMSGFIMPIPSYNDMVMYVSIVYQNGGRWTDPETGKPVVNDTAWKSVAQLYYDLIYKYKVTPSNVADLDYYKVIMMFLDGKAAMALGLTWVRAIQCELNVTTPFKWVLSLFPINTGDTYPRGKYSTVPMLMDATTTFYIMSTSKHRQEAWEFIKWLVLNGYISKWGPGCEELTGSGIYGRTPATYDQWQDPKWVETEPYLTNLYKSGKLFQGALPFPSFSGIIELLEKHLPDAVKAVILNQKTIDQAFNDFQAAAEQVLHS